MKLGIVVYGIAVIATGLVNIAFGAFDPDHQPIQAWSDHVPGVRLWAYLTGILLVVGGAAVLTRRMARYGAALLTIVYAAVAIFWLPRFVTAPPAIGYTAHTYIGILAGVCEPVIVIAAAVAIYAAAAPAGARAAALTEAVRWLFAVSVIAFGLQHLTGISMNVAFVPSWMPLGQAFWVIFTGMAFVLGGIGVLGRTAEPLAAKLTAVMFLVFSAATLLPGLQGSLRDESSWGGNACNIVAAASAWIVGSFLAARKQSAVRV